MSGTSAELWVQCENCGVKWVVARFPTPMHKLLEALKDTRKCPDCGVESVVICKTDEQH